MIRLIKLILTLTFLIPLFCHAQSITWEKLYGYPHSDEGAYDVCTSGDGNFFVVGNSGNNFLNGRIYVLKLNQYGDTLWTRKYNTGHYAFSVASSKDCGCVMTGQGIDSLYTLKIDCDGNILWQKIYPFGAICFDIQKVSDGGYIMCGYILFNGFLMKIDSLGNTVWFREYIASNQMGLGSCIETYDNGYLTGGYIRDPDTLKVVLIKVNNSGETVWENRYKILGRQAVLSTVIEVNQYYLIFGSTGFNTYISKINFSGAQMYSYLFPNESREVLYDAKLINSNKFVTTSSFYPKKDDSSYVVNRICDSLGNIIYSKNFSSPGYISFASILPLKSGDILFAGTNKPVPGSNDDYAYIIRSDSTLFSKPLQVSQLSNTIPKDIYLYQNFPNPFNPETKIKFDIVRSGFVTIKIFDVTGKYIQTLISESLSSGSYSVSFRNENLSSGLYFYKMTFNNLQIKTLKMFLLK